MSNRNFWELIISIDVSDKLSAEDVKELATKEIRHIFPKAEVLAVAAERQPLPKETK